MSAVSSHVFVNGIMELKWHESGEKKKGWSEVLEKQQQQRVNLHEEM